MTRGFPGGCIFLALVAGMTSPATAQHLPGLDSGRVVLIAHRGGLDHGYPENTLATFRHAIENGVEAIEIDLRGTKDGEIVVLHDASVDRTTEGRGKVAGMSLAEIRGLDAGGGERVPTFEEVLKLVSGSGVLLVVDVKKGATFDRAELLRLAELYGAIPHLVVGVSSVADLQFFRSRVPTLTTLGFVKKVEDIDAFVQAGIGIVRLWPQWIEENPGLIDRVRQLGKPVWVTAGPASREQLEALVRQGVSGILSDRLDVLHALRAR